MSTVGTSYQRNLEAPLAEPAAAVTVPETKKGVVVRALEAMPLPARIATFLTVFVGGPVATGAGLGWLAVGGFGGAVLGGVGFPMVLAVGACAAVNKGTRGTFF